MIGDDWLSAADAAAYATALASKWGRARLSVRTLLELARKGKIDFRSAGLPPVSRSRPGRPPHSGRKIMVSQRFDWLIMHKQLVLDCRTEPSHFFISDTLSSKKDRGFEILSRRSHNEGRSGSHPRLFNSRRGISDRFGAIESKSG